MFFFFIYIFLYQGAKYNPNIYGKILKEENNIFKDEKNIIKVKNVNLYPGGGGNDEEYYNSYTNINHNSLDRENMNR